MKQIVHLVPYDGTGGVETAARSMAGVSDEEFSFDVAYIFMTVAGRQDRTGTFNPLPLLGAVRRLARRRPEVLIVSLWRSCIVGILFKLLVPRATLVVFLHLPDDVHWADGFFTRLAMRLATEVWADSKATLARRARENRKQRVISFVTERLPRLPKAEPAPEFVFWGRISEQKGLDRAIRLFARIHARHPAARFRIIGPDGGVQQTITDLIGTLGLEQSVLLLGERQHGEIPGAVGGASFYLQTSLTEGMAMSVVEAMQMGLVPVVTPVGEIENYCRDGENAILVADDAVAEAGIDDLLRRPAKYRDLSSAAVATWLDRPLYRDDVLAACRMVIGNIG